MGCGSATTAIWTGKSRDVARMVRAVITTTNSPSVETIHRPNTATRTGLTTAPATELVVLDVQVALAAFGEIR